MTTELKLPETDQLTRLLEDVQRTIRENQQFIRSLKEDDGHRQDELEQDEQAEAAGDDEGDYEEL